MSLARIGDVTGFAKFVSLMSVSGLTTYYLMNPRQKRAMSPENVIVTTGCDSGLGYSLAIHCHKSLNMSVVACVHHIGSKGAIKLKEMFSSSDRSHVVELDVTRKDSVASVVSYVEELLEKNTDLRKIL